MPVVTDPGGREWMVEETGRSSGAHSIQPGQRLPEMTLATLRCTSGSEVFYVTIGARWRDLPPDELWRQVERARTQPHDGAEE